VERTDLNAKLLEELEGLKARLEQSESALEEANDLIRAIMNGEVDALVRKSDNGNELFTLKSADQNYRIFIERMTEAAVTLSLSGIILYCNSRFAEMLDIPLESIIGKPFSDFLTEKDQKYFQVLIQKGLQETVKTELCLLRTGGREMPVQFSMSSVAQNEDATVSVLLTDLTEQKRAQKLLEQKNAELELAQQMATELNANLEVTVKLRTQDLENTIAEKTIIEQELRSSQEQLSRILETMAEGVGIINLEGRMIYANPMAQKILGYSEDDTLGYIYSDPKWQNLHIDGTPLPAEKHPMQVTLTTGEPVYDYEVAVQPNDSERFYVSINAAPLKDENGNVIGGIGTFMDVTNRRKLIQQKDEFISVASHELKTPVTSLKASLQLLDRLKGKPESEMFGKLVDQANKSMGKISVLIEDLLNVSKYNSGQLHINKKRFSLFELVQECCQEVRTAGKYVIRSKGDPSIVVEADPDKIDQVVVNFINNAIKYAPDSLEIAIDVKRVNNQARVSVTDQGPGIDPEKAPYIFDRYYRVDNSNMQYSGLGLGLYICSEIIKKHQGEIGVDSVPGRGSTFWFSLPLERS
jgi:two-component system, OmpR family, phosphate regulon sensor histidine kinase PhoR